MADSDHELMRQSADGDPAAFETLLRRWEPRVARLLNRLTGASRNGAAAQIEDLSQEVFVRVLTARHRYRAEYAFSTWLYRIVLNVARDAGRRKRTQRKLLDNHRPPGQAEVPDETAQWKEVEQCVAEALAELPKKWREPLVLRHYGGMTFQEVAETLGLPASTVKSRVRQGLLKLRAELKNRGIDERDLDHEL